MLKCHFYSYFVIRFTFLKNLAYMMAVMPYLHREDYFMFLNGLSYTYRFLFYFIFLLFFNGNQSLPGKLDSTLPRSGLSPKSCDAPNSLFYF